MSEGASWSMTPPEAFPGSPDPVEKGSTWVICGFHVAALGIVYLRILFLILSFSGENSRLCLFLHLGWLRTQKLTP